METRCQMNDPYVPAAESIYNRLTVYRFARPYTEGKSVAVVGREADGYRTSLLAKTAGSVTCLVSETPSGIASAPNVTCQKVTLPDLPYPEGYFDTVVALQAIETLKRPENLILEMKRVLNKEGTLILSTPDKQTYSNDRNFRDPHNERELYVPEFKELLEKNFERVELYRQSSVGGSLILDLDVNLSGVTVRANHFSMEGSPVDLDPPPASYILALCSDRELSETKGCARLLLDKDRLVFEENEELRDGVELLREEVSQMQETEVQAFRETLRIERQRVAQLGKELERSRNELERSRNELERTRNRLKEIRSSHAWRWISRYRRLRDRLSASRRPG